MNITAILIKVNGEKGYSAKIAEIPGVNSQGKTKQEALTNIKKALEEHFDYGPEQWLQSLLDTVDSTDTNKIEIEKVVIGTINAV